MRVVGYPRASTDDQKISPEAQAEKIRAYCASQGHDLVDLVFDAGESASSLDRPGLTRALGMLSDGTAGGIVVAKLDRLTRSVGDFETLLARHFSAEAGRSLFSASEEVDTRTASGRMILRIKVAVSQYELEVNHERTEDALGHKQSRGERTGSVPYGFDLDESGPMNSKGRPVRLTPNPAEQAVIGQILDLKRRGASDRGIASTLNALEVPTKTGAGPWRHSTVAKILDRQAPENHDAPAEEVTPAPA